MPALCLPPDVEAVFRRFYTCEFTTITRDGQPVTWPTAPYYDAPSGRLIVATSIAFPVKAHNARRRPQVALLFSDPTGSGLTDPPAVLVQGHATVAEMIGEVPWALAMLRQTLDRQPAGKQFLASRLARRLFTFYFQRIAITVQPQRIRVWPHGDFAQATQELAIHDVE